MLFEPPTPLTTCRPARSRSTAGVLGVPASDSGCTRAASAYLAIERYRCILHLRGDGGRNWGGGAAVAFR